MLDEFLKWCHLNCALVSDARRRPGFCGQVSLEALEEAGFRHFGERRLTPDWFVVTSCTHVKKKKI